MAEENASHKDADLKNGQKINGLMKLRDASSPLRDEHSNWTDVLPATDHIRFFKDIDWEASPLGHPRRWSPALQFAVNMAFADSRGACVYWGPSRVAIYNKPFVPMAAGAHPKVMGQPFEVGYPELWPNIKPIFDYAETECKTVDVDNIPLMTERNGYLEEAYFIGQFIPLRAATGNVEGFYNTVYESTAQVLHERRRRLTNAISALANTAVASMAKRLVDTLRTNDRDVPMALLYSADEVTQPSKCVLQLQGTIGVRMNHPSAVDEADLKDCNAGYFPLFRQAHAKAAPIVLRESDGSLKKHAEALLEDLDWQGFGEACKNIVIIPLIQSQRLFGFFVIGTNPRREWSTDCEQFVTDLAQQLVFKLASATSVDEAMRREAKLVENLAALEKRIHWMAHYAPVGLVHVNVEDGRLTWANDYYYNLTGHPRSPSDHYAESFLDVYLEEDKEAARSSWNRLLAGNHTALELRLKRLFEPKGGLDDDTQHHMCVIALGFPLMGDGQVKYIMGCLTDISEQKYAETIQACSAEAAQKAKRQQEEFIDTISHELRNPLGAIFHLAESISTSMEELKSSAGKESLAATLKSNVDAANTILACAKHQKRIIDDVLILSRLDSMMLSITPVIIEPQTVVHDVVNMFRGELASKDMRLKVVQDQSVSDLGIREVHCDPSRLTQIFINLISNAIKFTRTQEVRLITVTYGASLDEILIHQKQSDVRWLPTHKKKVDLTLAPEWGNGEHVYLCFSITDTGPGIAPDEIDRLFQKFAQATPRTHITYGGSGLGLYISRELTEKQGGEIGVASFDGNGSTFSFYVKSRRASPAIADKPTEPSVVAPRPKLARATTQPTSSSHVHSVKPRRQKLSLLLVEDNPVNQRILRKQLEKAHCDVYVANHGREALAFLEKASCWTGKEKTGINIDIVLTDWEMPIMDGIECSRRIRQLEKEGKIVRRTVIIALTANARNEQVQKAHEAGIDDVVPKPFLVADLMERMRQLLAKTSMQPAGK